MARSRRDDYDQVSGVFSSYRELTRLLEELHRRGYRESDLSMLMSEKTRNDFAARENTKAPEGASFGGLAGGLLGALLGGLTLAGTILAPGVGLLVSGPLVGALSGGAVGMMSGALIGALVGLGIPEHEARFFEQALQEEGHVLLVAHVPHAESRRIKLLFEYYGARQARVSF